MTNPTLTTTKTPSKRPRTRKNASLPSGQADELILPIAQETERDLLGMLMLEDDALSKALAAGLTADLFALPSHRLVFKALQEVQAKGWDINPATLGDYLDSQHSLEKIGGKAGLAELIRGGVPTTKSIPGLLRQLRDIRYKRDAAKKAVELQRLASNGASPDEIEQLLESFPRADVTVQAYAATPSGLIHRRPAKQGFGFDTETLTNFTARIVAELIEDDGASDEQRFFEIEVSLKGELKRVNVSAKKFGAMTWPTELLGAAAIIEPQRAERAKVAIQRLSPSIQKRTVYTHTGWRLIDGEWCYLHSGGAITASGNRTDVAVKLSKSLQHFTLPEPAKDEAQRESYRAALALLDAIPLHLSVPLLGGVFASVLGNADYSIYFTGETGSYKSELTAFAQSFFGSGFERVQLPAHWDQDSVGHILLKAFVVKDALLVIDDFAPNGNKKHDEVIHDKAESVFRAQGNKAGRGTLHPDRSERAAKEPRGLLMSSGEDLPKGTSLQARLVIVPIKQGEVSKEILSAMQALATEGAFARCLSTFLSHLARDYETIRNIFRADCITKRDELAEALKGHARQPTAVAHLASAWSIWLEAALLANAISEAEHRELWGRVWQALSASGEAQKEHQSSQHPADYFLELLRSALVSGKVYVTTFDGHQPNNKQMWGWLRDDMRGEHIGWLDEENQIVCLEPKSCYKALHNYGQAIGEGLPVTIKTLWLRVYERGLMALYSGPRNLDNKTGLNKVDNHHHEKTTYSGLQSAGRAGNAQRGADAKPTRGEARGASESVAAVERTGTQRAAALV